jgi:NOL1/NOP2/fmu family ribosome biogenesis protein
MRIQILDKAKKKKIISQLENFGIKKIPQLLVRTGNERICAYSGGLSVEEIISLWRIMPIEGIGLYVGKEIADSSGTREIRLSVDGINLWKEQITKKIFILTEEQEKEWFRGRNIEMNESQKEEFKEAKGFLVVKSYDKKDFVGTGKVGKGVLYGFLPKERRRKSLEI